MVHTEYYETLGISPTATTAEIKKAYHKLALKYHPDKNKEDPEAEVLFQRIAEAYNVLSDPTQRALYDTHGKVESSTITVGMFLKKEFGIELLENLLGEPVCFEAFEQACASAQTGSNTDSFVLEREKLDKRVLFIYEALQKKTALYTEGNYTREEFEIYLLNETLPLCTENKSVAILKLLGEIYYSCAGVLLEKSFLGLPKYIYYSAKNTLRGFRFSTRAIMASLKLYRLLKKAEKSELNETMAKELQNNFLAVFRDVFYAETNFVFRKAIKKLLFDLAVPENLRQRRAVALKIIGGIYKKMEAK